MNELLDQRGLVFLWLGFTALMICVVSALFLWAVRSRQFSDQDRARYLPLKSGCADNYPECDDGKGRKVRDDL